MSITTASSGESGQTVSSNTPYSNSDEFTDERLPGSAVAPTLQNATYIDVNDSNFQEEVNQERIKHYERLELYNRGTHNGKWTKDQTQRHDQDDWYFCNALTAQMGLSERGRLLTWRAFKSQDMRTYTGFRLGKPKETERQYLVAFCIGAIIHNKLHNQRMSNDNWRYYPAKNYEPKMERYQCPKRRLETDYDGADEGDRHRTIERCAEQLEFAPKLIRQCIETVRPNLPKWVTHI